MLVNTLNHCAIGLWVYGANFNEAGEALAFGTVTVEVSEIVAIIVCPHVVTIHQSTIMLIVFQNRNEIKMRVRDLPPVLMMSFSALNHCETKKTSSWILVINQLFSHLEIKLVFLPIIENVKSLIRISDLIGKVFLVHITIFILFQSPKHFGVLTITAISSVFHDYFLAVFVHLIPGGILQSF